MKYELEVFDRIISGNLSPFAVETTDPLKFNKALQEKHTSCFNYTIATFKKAGSKFTLLDKKVMSSFHPSVEKLITPQQNLFQTTDIESIAQDAYKLLQLKKQNIVSVSYARQPGKTIVYIKESRKCEEIPFNEAKYFYYYNLLKEEVARIKSAIKATVFEYSTPLQIEQYIHKQQSAIVSLSFQLLKLLNADQCIEIYKTTENFSDVDILNYAYICLEDLLRFFEKNYFSFIDGNIQVPSRSALVKIYEINEKLEVVKSALLSSDINPALLKLIYVPFLKLNAIKFEERISYKELIYANAYLTAFYEEIEGNNGAINELQVKDILHQVNYNSLDLLEFKTDIFKSSLAQYDAQSEKIDYLYHCLKTVNQRQCKLRIAFNPDLPSLKQQLTGWLEEEINYLTKKITLAYKAQTVNLFSGEERVKLQTGLSVAQLAFFFKLQADVGIISHKIQRDIFRHIAENYQTSKVFEISVDSISNKYYNIETSTIDVIKEKVIEILNQIKEH